MPAAIKDRLLTYNASLNAAFRRIDGDSTGYVSAAEIKNFFRDAYLGDVVNDRTLAALIDMADFNGDDEIDYAELSAVIECDDLLELAALVPDKKIVAKSLQEGKKTVGKYGVHGRRAAARGHDHQGEDSPVEHQRTDGAQGPRRVGRWLPHTRGDQAQAAGMVPDEVHRLLHGRDAR